MYPLKQSTGITIPFFAHDVNGDGVTGLTDGSFTKRISKNGAGFGAMTVTITEMEGGWYSFPLSTSHSDTVGILSIRFTNAGCKAINLQFRVHAALPDDISGRIPAALVSGRIDASVGAMAANVLTAAAINAAALNGKGDWSLASALTTHDTDIKARLPAALVSGRIDASVGAMAANVITASAIQAAAIAAGKIGAGAITATEAPNLDAAMSTRAAASALATVQADTDDIQTRLPAALVGGRMAANAEVVGDKTGYALTAAYDPAKTAAQAGDAMDLITDAVDANALAADAVAEIAAAIDVVATAASLNKRAASFVLTTGGVVSGDYTDTFTPNATYHQTQDTAGVYDAYYEFDVGFSAAPTGVTIIGKSTGPNDPMNVYAYNFLTTTWELLGTMPGVSSGDQTFSYPLLVAHIGVTGADIGLVRIRFANTGLTSSSLYIDQLWVSYAVIPLRIGYVGQVTAVGADWIELDAAAVAVDNYYKPGLVVVIAGTGSDQYSRVLSYVGSSKRAYLATPFATALDTSSVVQIYPWGSVRVTELEDDVITAASIDVGAAIGLTTGAIDDIFSEVIEGSIPFAEMLRIFMAALANKSAGGGTASITFRDVGDTKDRITATVDANGNRLSVTVDGS